MIKGLVLSCVVVASCGALSAGEHNKHGRALETALAAAVIVDATLRQAAGAGADALEGAAEAAAAVIPEAEGRRTPPTAPSRAERKPNNKGPKDAVGFQSARGRGSQVRARGKLMIPGKK